MIASTSTISGTAAGFECRKCWTCFERRSVVRPRKMATLVSLPSEPFRIPAPGPFVPPAVSLAHRPCSSRGVMRSVVSVRSDSAIGIARPHRHGDQCPEPSALTVRSAPALGRAFLGVDRVHAGGRLVGDERRRRCRRSPCLRSASASRRSSANFLIASMPSAAISSGYCCEVAPMTPSVDRLDARAAAVDGDDQHIAFPCRQP